MKNSNTKIKLVARVMLLILLLASAVNLSGCIEGWDTTTNDSKDKVSGLEYGFEFELLYPLWENPGKSAYKSNKTEFDIDDVTLTFYYGESFSLKTDGSIHTDVATMTVPHFDLYFYNDEGVEYLIRHVEEEWTSIKYHVERTYIEYEKNGEKHTKLRYDFNHSEDITIPKELFTKEEGHIVFRTSTTHYPGKLIMGGSLATIFYQRDGDKVILSSKEFK